ncbi:hypothetical protein KA021_01885 [Candidatus Saccharibacteria bacterium]|jgi:hypothetical protein|nr:hypothetical protein [Candidatus Saccharibacteria bacterium]
MNGICVTSRPILEQEDAFILMNTYDENLEKYYLQKHDDISITLHNDTQKYCAG